MKKPSWLSRLGFAVGSIGTDVKIGLRLLAREKSFCAIAVGVLALGIGAVTTQFSVVNGILLRGLPFPESDRLVTVELAKSWTESDATLNPKIMPADYADLETEQTCFETMAGWLWLTAANVNHNGTTVRRQAGYVTHDFFRMLGVAPAVGRDFSADDDRDGVAPTIMLSDRLWRDEFGADPRVVGSPLRVNGRVGTVIGVMPRGFAFPYDEQLWIAMRAEHPVKPRHEHTGRAVTVYARLKPGVTLAQASAEIAVLAERLANRYPENATLKLGRVRPLLDSFTAREAAGLLFTLLTFCAGVLLIACVNVANMQFARATVRLREFAIRASFGASRSRLVRQLLTENLLLAAGGAILGTGAAVWMVGWLDGAVRQFRPPLPEWMRFSVDGRALLLVVAAVVVATVVSGLMPAMVASRVSGLAAELKDGGRGATNSRTGVLTRGLVVFQILATCVLLIGSLLQVRSVLRQEHIDHGYDTTAVLTARYMLMPGDYPTDASRAAFNERALRELRAQPTVESAAMSERYRMILLPDGPVEIEGQTALREADRPVAASERVTDGYFATLGQRVVAGRDFSPEDNDLRRPVAVVNETFARMSFPQGAVGRRIRPVNPDPKIQEPWRVIVGVVSDVRMAGPFASRASNAGYYLPLTSTLCGKGKPTIGGLQYVTVVIRPRGGVRPDACVAAIRSAIDRVDRETPIFFVGTPQAQFDTYLGQTRLVSLLSLVVGTMAVVLAAAGLYGVTAHGVNGRLREFGIRLALGAERGQVLWMVLKQAGVQIAVGLLLGIAATAGIAAAARSSLSRMLFETDPFDPLVYGGVALLLAIVAFFAAWMPARRAVRVDPVEALHEQ
ncbi:permease [Opitutaceae bacterium EW11]|nr:permease [Opitutaceae bacterium EW11]